MFKKAFSKRRKLSLLTISLIIAMFLSACSQESNNALSESDENHEINQDISKTRVIKDMADREVEIPSEVKSVYSATPIGTAAIYTINPEKLAAKSFELTELEKKYTVKIYHDLPVLGKFMMGENGNEEELLKINPDVVIFMGTLNDQLLSQVDKISKKLEIPVLAVDGDLKNTEKAYRFLGDLLGEEDRANKLADYSRDTLKEAKEIAEKIPENEKLKVYYAQGDGGLTTNSKGSIHVEVIDMVGGVNVVESRSEGHGRAEVSMEQVLNWNPHVVITDKQLKRTILEDSNWSSIEAIKDKKVFGVPMVPFNWLDSPPSVARIMGIKWAGNLLYPQYFDYDIKQETKNFYKKFYNLELNDEQLNEIMEDSIYQ